MLDIGIPGSRLDVHPLGEACRISGQPSQIPVPYLIGCVGAGENTVPTKGRVTQRGNFDVLRHIIR